MNESRGVTFCFKCGAELGLVPGNIGRGETCLKCSADVRVCYNCLHYDESSYNECKEPMAERVVDKDKRNFCDYFSLRAGKASRKESSKEQALKQLDALFKKP